MCLVVSHSNSTSNHNGHANEYIFAVLFLIPILHQTTTCMAESISKISLFLIPILHQTTTCLLRFQLLLTLFLIPILHQTTTPLVITVPNRCCFSFQFYIKPQHIGLRFALAHCCFSFQFYIKPQRWPLTYCHQSVVSHSNSTSNHNNVDFSVSAMPVVSHSNSTSNHNTPKSY